MGSLLLVLALGGWLFFSGRLGFGPLSAEDEAAAAEIAEEIAAPIWTDDDAVACAADTLLHDTRSKELAEHGTVEKEAEAWAYTEEWEAGDALVFAEGLLECSANWVSAVADEWNLDEKKCLRDLGTGTMRGFFAGVMFDVADNANADAVEELDGCYVTKPKAPKGKAKPGYRSVTFELDTPEVENATTRIEAHTGAGFDTVHGDSHTVETKEGGERTCTTVRTIALYAWGTTRLAKSRLCGKATPKKLWWEPTDTCGPNLPGDYECFLLRYEGFRSAERITATLTHNGGNCFSTDGDCTPQVLTPETGRGVIVSFGLPGDYIGNFVAKVGDLEAAVPTGPGQDPGDEPIA